MEKQTKQKRVLTKAKELVGFDVEAALAAVHAENAVSGTEKGKGMFLSPQDAEEYRAYKRRKKVEEIMAAIAKSEASLINGEDPQRVCERAIRLKQAAIKVPPSWLPQAKTYLGGSKVKIDCVIGGNGETLTKVKAYEMRVALKGNAKELTVFLAPSLLTHGRFQEIKKELKKLCRTARTAVVKVWVNSDYPFATLSKVARICCEVGVKYFCVPYFAGCERLRFDLTNGCQIEVSEVESLAEYRRLCESGVGRIVTRNIWEIYSEWMKEADKLSGVENVEPPVNTQAAPPVENSPSMKTETTAQTALIKTENDKTALVPNVAAQAEKAEPQREMRAEEKPPENGEEVNLSAETKEVVNGGADKGLGHARLEGSDLKFL